MDVEPSVTRITDVATLKAMTHPLRMRLLGLLRGRGPATATTLSAEVGESVASVSYHLRQLDRYGFVAEAPEHARDGRERWWRATSQYTSWSAVDFLDLPEGRAAEVALRRQVLDGYDEGLRRFVDTAPQWGGDWVDAADSSDYALELTPDQARALRDELHAVVRRHLDREPDDGDVARVRAILHLFPTERPAPHPTDGSG